MGIRNSWMDFFVRISSSLYPKSERSRRTKNASTLASLDRSVDWQNLLALLEAFIEGQNLRHIEAEHCRVVAIFRNDSFSQATLSSISSIVHTRYAMRDSSQNCWARAARDSNRAITGTCPDLQGASGEAILFGRSPR
jgi:hypothetical protein